jgi:hypothetical protein
MPPHLRVFPASPEPAESDGPPATVRVSLGSLLPLLTLAHRHNYLWLQDFLDDEVCVTPDLYEVLRSFGCQRPSAG